MMTIVLYSDSEEVDDFLSVWTLTCPYIVGVART
jgi:hypothetical protein